MQLYIKHGTTMLMTVMLNSSKCFISWKLQHVTEYDYQ